MARGKARAVVKIDQNGKIVETYRSIQQAADRNYMCKMNAYYRVKGRLKNPWRDGFALMYADEAIAKYGKDYKEVAMGLGPVERKQALERERKKKPEKKQGPGRYIAPVCPNCGGENICWGMIGYNYCPDCGQHLDFEGWIWL